LKTAYFLKGLYKGLPNKSIQLLGEKIKLFTTRNFLTFTLFWEHSGNAGFGSTNAIDTYTDYLAVPCLNLSECS
jgi:hypothetical protein